METKLMFSLPKCFRQAAIPRLLNDITLSYMLNMERHILKKCRKQTFYKEKSKQW